MNLNAAVAGSSGVVPQVFNCRMADTEGVEPTYQPLLHFHNKAAGFFQNHVL